MGSHFLMERETKRVPHPPPHLSCVSVRGERKGRHFLKGERIKGVIAAVPLFNWCFLLLQEYQPRPFYDPYADDPLRVPGGPRRPPFGPPPSTYLVGLTLYIYHNHF